MIAVRCVHSTPGTCSVASLLLSLYMDAWGTFPLAAKLEKRQPARNPNWTLGSDDQPPKRVSHMGVEMERQRGTIEGSRTALKQFAARNQRIVADPFPNQNSYPRAGVAPATPQSSVVATRVTYNPALQTYQSRDVAGTPSASRGLASDSCCFSVDPSLGSRQWRSTNLDVSDITARHASQQPAGRPTSARPSSARPEWWGA